MLFSPRPKENIEFFNSNQSTEIISIHPRGGGKNTNKSDGFLLSEIIREIIDTINHIFILDLPTFN